MMISFCRKITPHSFLGLTTTTATTTTTTSIDAHEKLPLKCHNYMSPLTNSTRSGGGLLGLVTPTNYDHIKHQPLVLESSSSIKSSTSSPSSDSSSPPSPPPRPIEFETKKDPGGFGFIDDIGGGVDGLMSCTESLGFESSDERLVDDHQIVERVSHLLPNEDDKEYHEEDACLRMMRQSIKIVSKGTRMGERRVQLEAKKFPPPLSSLNQNGQPRYYLRPVRKDGRLELKEVRIYRPEVLRAHRQDGRLRLHLVSHEPLHEEEEPLERIEEVEEEEMEEEVVEEEENMINVKREEEEVEEEEERVGGEWKLTVGGEGFRRCHNLVSRHHVHHHHHHHHSNLAVWNQQQHCVTTR